MYELVYMYTSISGMVVHRSSRPCFSGNHALPLLLSWFRFSSVPALSVANCVPSTGNRCLPSGKLVC